LVDLKLTGGISRVHRGYYLPWQVIGRVHRGYYLPWQVEGGLYIGTPIIIQIVVWRYYLEEKNQE